jgi:hypothetical protein
MNNSPRLPASWTRTLGGVALLLATALGNAAPPSESGPAADSARAQALYATHQRMSEKLDHSSFGRPVQLDSVEAPGGLQGDVYAVVDHPLSEIGATLNGAARWCEVMTLHINNRRCRPDASQQGHETLTLFVVQRYDKPVEQAFELPFVYRVSSATPEHLQMEMSSASGPLGTSNYHVALEAVALDEHKSFVHFSYSYEHNMMVRFTTEAYLSTFGRNKVGFTVTGKGPDGQPEYIRGLRGLVERNAMRYFLALDTYLAAPAREQAERRQRNWFAAAEQYPLQLHEVNLETYLALKREDKQHQSAGR